MFLRTEMRYLKIGYDLRKNFTAFGGWINYFVITGKCKTAVIQVPDSKKCK